MSANLATATWRTLLSDVLLHGTKVDQDSAGAAWRGHSSLELVAHRTIWPMALPIVACPGRKVGWRFLAAEAAWILSGDNRLDKIKPYAMHLAKLSDDGIFMGGSYGPPFVEQLSYVINALERDSGTRQAVMTFWRSRPGNWFDVPCTISLEFLIRPPKPVDERYHLHTVATMRSSDVWMGVPYDVHSFSMMTALVALYLRKKLMKPVDLGDLYLTAGSQHLYTLDRPAAEACVERDDASFELALLNLDELSSPDDLVTHLWGIAERNRDKLRCGWLRETLE